MSRFPFGHRAVTRPESHNQSGWFQYVCGHCGSSVSGAVLGSVENGSAVMRWLQCTVCTLGTVYVPGQGMYPGPVFGPEIEGLPADVLAAYGEARRCLSVNATTAAEGICRKILMYIAVDKGATAGKTFKSYIEFLESEGFVTPPMRAWVTLIKDNGNEAQHELKAPERKRAEGTLLFTAQLLRTVYEMAHIADAYAAPPPPASSGTPVISTGAASK